MRDADPAEPGSWDASGAGPSDYNGYELQRLRDALLAAELDSVLLRMELLRCFWCCPCF